MERSPGEVGAAFAERDVRLLHEIATVLRRQRERHFHTDHRALSEGESKYVGGRLNVLEHGEEAEHIVGVEDVFARKVVRAQLQLDTKLDEH